jgi:hypothetical protein
MRHFGSARRSTRDIIRKLLSWTVLLRLINTVPDASNLNPSLSTPKNALKVDFREGSNRHPETQPRHTGPPTSHTTCISSTGQKQTWFEKASRASHLIRENELACDGHLGRFTHDVSTASKVSPEL